MDSYLSTLGSAAKEQFMCRAIDLALQGKGFTAPNPCVGALLTQGEKIVAEGWHQKYGAPHAEVMAIQRAKEKGIDLSQTALWVTLEPCNHQGKTPPCSEFILKNGVRYVFVGVRDPNTSVNGGGIEFLRKNGIKVEVGIAEQGCKDLIADFILWQNESRPYVYLKLASTLDGKIGTSSGDSAWITGVQSREKVHHLRSQVQTILIGGNTFYSDNPRLTCRTKAKHSQNQPMAVVVATHLPDPASRLHLIQERPKQLIFWTNQETYESSEIDFLLSQGIQVWTLPYKDFQMNFKEGLKRLYQEFNTFYLLCEGGGRLAMSLIEQRVVDELHLFLAPKILGDSEGISSFSGRVVRSIDEAIPWRICQNKKVGEDLLLTLRPHL